MIFANEMEYNKIYNKPFYLPINEKDKRKNSVVFLLTPNLTTSIDILNSSMIINKRIFESYYIEKDVTVYINENNNIIYENFTTKKDLEVTEDVFKINENTYTILNENNDKNMLSSIRNILRTERFKNDKEVFNVYDVVKENVRYINKTFLSLSKYKEFNLFIDLFHYNSVYLNNNTHINDTGIERYFEFINKLVNDARLDENGYKKKTIILPLFGWNIGDSEVDILNYKQDINPLSMIIRLCSNMYYNKYSSWKDIDILVLSHNSSLKVNLFEINKKNISRIKSLLYTMIKNDSIIEKEDYSDDETTKAIVNNIIDKIEKSQNIKIYNITGDSGDEAKDELVKKIEDIAQNSENTDDAIEKMEDDKRIKDIIMQLSSQDSNNVNINPTRLSRMNKLNDAFYNKVLNGKTVRDLIEDDKKRNEELPIKSLDIDTVNEDWSKLQYVNFEDNYVIEEDIALILNHFSSTTHPISVIDVSIENTTTSEDYKDTYSVKMEDYEGNRFTLNFDVPKLKDNKFMVLRGNDKVMNGQLMLLPITKTDINTVQIVSNYKKIFVERANTSKGKSFVVTDRIIKTLEKNDIKDVKYTYGQNSLISRKYDLPIDYIDLADTFSKIETKNHLFLFNQDEIRDKYKVDDKKGIPYAINKKTEELLYFDGNGVFSNHIYNILLEECDGFEELYKKTSVSTKYTYSQAIILSSRIPLIVIMAYNEGLIKAMEKANIEYSIEEKRPTYDKNTHDIIKFNDGYIVYKLNYNSSLLMNGLKACNTEMYDLSQINNKAMYIDFLEIFGNRLIADGLDNFYDLMIDPITKSTLEYYELPTDYIEILAYANYLLSDNNYIKHVDMRSNRYRSNEIIAGYVYQALARAYESYRIDTKRGRKSSMSVKQSVVLDSILEDPTCADKSTLNPLLDLESINAVSFKGLSGMNTERSYGLDKRTYHDSMSGILGMSTGFAGNVGIVRQGVIDMNITGKRGYLKINDNKDNNNPLTKTFTITEALTPLGTTRDDPFRSAMNYIQTSKHAMRTKISMPLLISNGAEEALPYITPNDFAFKAKENGEVVEITNDYMIVKYNDGFNDFIDLRDNIKKNSNGGFYTTVKLSTDFKVGKKFKQGDILAYDKSSYSNIIGHRDNIGYNIGVLTKVAMLNTDEGFEDSAIISEYLSDAMASDVVIQKDVSLSKDSNILHMVEKGQDIQEGDSLLIFQNSFEEEDLNILLKNLSDDEDVVSDLGRIPIKSKITGEVKDIKIYRTVDKEELSDSLKKVVNKYEKEISKIKSIMKKYNIEYVSTLGADYTLDNTGKLKNVNEGVLIEFYLKYEDKMSIGDKLIYFSALKGVVKNIFPEGDEPRTQFRPDEKIHSLLSIGSVFGRMVCSVQYHLAINKLLVELDRKIKEKAGIKWKYLEDMNYDR